MKMSKSKQKVRAEYVGQDFDQFLEQNGIAADVEALAIKKVLVALLESAGMTQGELAEKLQTSRTQVRRLLDPENTSITLATLQRAASVAGHRLVIGFKPIKKHSVVITQRDALQTTLAT
jgi:antitoxin HicB